MLFGSGKIIVFIDSSSLFPVESIIIRTHKILVKYCNNLYYMLIFNKRYKFHTIISEHVCLLLIKTHAHISRSLKCLEFVSLQTSSVFLSTQLLVACFFCGRMCTWAERVQQCLLVTEIVTA